MDLGIGFSHTLLQKLAEAVTPLGVSPPEVSDTKVVYIIGNTSCEPRPGAAFCPQLSQTPRVCMKGCLEPCIHSATEWV